MVVARQEGRHPHGRMFFVSIVLLVLVRHCELTPMRRVIDSSSPTSSSVSVGSPSATRRFQSLSSSNDLAWQAWLVMDLPTEVHSRITPKSIFFPPDWRRLVQTCAEGYVFDATGKCVKNVNIETIAQQDFIAQRLKEKFRISSSNSGAFGVSSSSNSYRPSSGPTRVKIPLSSNGDSQSIELEHEETRGESVEVPALVPHRGKIHSDTKEPEAVVAIYEVKNDTSLEEDETTFFHSNINASVDESQSNVKPQETIVAIYEVKNGTSLEEDDTTFFHGNVNGSMDEMESNEKGKEAVVAIYEVKNSTSLVEDEEMSFFRGNTSDTSLGEMHSERNEEEAIVTIYEVKNETSLEEDETAFFRGNASTSVPEKDNQAVSSELDTVVPVADFVDDANETSYSDVVDYKIPINMEMILKRWNLLRSNDSDDEDTAKNKSRSSNTTERAPMLFFLLPTTRLPTTAPPDVNDRQDYDQRMTDDFDDDQRIIDHLEDDQNSGDHREDDQQDDDHREEDQQDGDHREEDQQDGDHPSEDQSEDYQHEDDHEYNQYEDDPHDTTLEIR